MLTRIALLSLVLFCLTSETTEAQLLRRLGRGIRGMAQTTESPPLARPSQYDPARHQYTKAPEPVTFVPSKGVEPKKPANGQSASLQRGTARNDQQPAKAPQPKWKYVPKMVTYFDAATGRSYQREVMVAQAVTSKDVAKPNPNITAPSPANSIAVTPASPQGVGQASFDGSAGAKSGDVEYSVFVSPLTRIPKVDIGAEEPASSELLPFLEPPTTEKHAQTGNTDNENATNEAVELPVLEVQEDRKK